MPKTFQEAIFHGKALLVTNPKMDLRIIDNRKDFLDSETPELSFNYRFEKLPNEKVKKNRIIMKTYDSVFNKWSDKEINHQIYKIVITGMEGPIYLTEQCPKEFIRDINCLNPYSEANSFIKQLGSLDYCKVWFQVWLKKEDKEPNYDGKFSYNDDTSRKLWMLESWMISFIRNHMNEGLVLRKKDVITKEQYLSALEKLGLSEWMINH